MDRSIRQNALRQVLDCHHCRDRSIGHGSPVRCGDGGRQGLAAGSLQGKAARMRARVYGRMRPPNDLRLCEVDLRRQGAEAANGEAVPQPAEAPAGIAAQVGGCPCGEITWGGNNMRQLICAVAAASAAPILVPALGLDLVAVAQTVGKPSGEWCPVGGAKHPSCRGGWRAVCLARSPVQCEGPGPHGQGTRLRWVCLQWSCHKLNPQAREPFKGPKPLPWSRRLPPSPITR